ncbi:MAG: AbrB family transcriptional regulator [Methylothermaceae bacteria B42]|nr:MAG: AbrB family transcriptional regulator [Methylothermaceae bacteria B42]HHJ38379.1 AbrB/MazE/SpoVT family DNA-binding domain-containing protein [Methylothermaceae bacterium]
MTHIVKVTTKGQATIPADIRKILGICPGDRIVWEVDEKGIVRVRRATPLDMEYLKAVEETLGEWHSEADEEAFRDL